MKKVRKDTKGRVLHRGESYNKAKSLYCYAYTDSFGHRRYKYTDELVKLRKFEEQIERDRVDKINVYAMSNADLNYVFDRYISTKNDLRSSTMHNYVYTYNRYVRNGFGKNKVADIRYSDVLRFYHALCDRGLKVSTVETVHGLLHPALQMALRDNVIRNNPSDGTLAEVKKRFKGRAEPRHALTYEEQCEFLSFLDRPENERWKPLFTVMFGTGCRIGEIIGLRWQDVDFKENYISINHNITYYPRGKSSKSEFEIGLPKTEAGIRTIPLLDKVRQALLDEKKFQEENDCPCIMELDGMSGFIFCNRFGMIHTPSGINKVIRRIVSDHNAWEEVRACREGRSPLMIPYFSCHITRHTFCSRLCENETNIKVIQSVMGHKDVQTTLDIYAEVSESKRQEIFKELNSNRLL